MGEEDNWFQSRHIMLFKLSSFKKKLQHIQQNRKVRPIQQDKKQSIECVPKEAQKSTYKEFKTAI